ncbi:MAG: hypothetical protein E6Q97_38875 [Desulfurellales bacterium]|nr:MAG: hypothetical protein E6Q97_38875 [Desulfurellales bacterium]
MRNITARGYMVSRLSGHQIDDLHRREMADGFETTPSRIHEMFGLMEVGDVPQESFFQTERRCVAIYEKARADYRGRHTGCCFLPPSGGAYTRPDDKCAKDVDVSVFHIFDREVVNQKIQFPTPSSRGKARERMESAE